MNDAKVGMVPIEGNFTSKLLERFDEDFMEWALKVLEDRNSGEPSIINKAIYNAPHFRATVNAGIRSALEFEDGREGSQRRGCGMLVCMCLMLGWKLCEMRMAELAGVESKPDGPPSSAGGGQ